MFVAENTNKDDKKTKHNNLVEQEAEGATVNDANKLNDRVPLSYESCGTQFYQEGMLKDHIEKIKCL